jgi:hypothetical protein
MKSPPALSAPRSYSIYQQIILQRVQREQREKKGGRFSLPLTVLAVLDALFVKIDIHSTVSAEHH